MRAPALVVCLLSLVFVFAGPATGQVAQPVGKISLGGTTSPSGEPIQIDYPVEQWIRNIGSRVDGAGMCVASSIEMSLRWANREEYRGFRDWAAQWSGGAWPGKVDKYFADFVKAKGLPEAQYVQYEGRDVELLKLALKTGRLPSITYSGRDGVRYRSPIAHMTCLAHYDEAKDEAAILDNNVSGTELIWMSCAEFRDRWMGGRSGWAVVVLYNPPAPIPKN